MSDGALSQELREMARADQDMRRRWVAGGEYDPDVDRRNGERLRQIIEERGWPRISEVGAEAAHWAWLLAQHADHDPAFQVRVLSLMRTLPLGEVAPADTAYLEDRIAVRSGGPQRYGTQFRVSVEGGVEAYSIERPDELDARRAAVGLNTFAEYREQVTANQLKAAAAATKKTEARPAPV